LKLPITWKVHPVIHTSYLTPWKDDSATLPKREPPPPDPEVIDGEEHLHVEAFRAKRVRRGMLEYLVKWSGFPEEENEFITAKQLQEDMSEDAFQKVLDDFNRKQTSRLARCLQQQRLFNAAAQGSVSGATCGRPAVTLVDSGSCLTGPRCPYLECGWHSPPLCFMLIDPRQV